MSSLLSSSEEILRMTSLDSDLTKRIKNSNIFLVGAGGIGCEVLKGLLLNGFPRITIIDLDTIDVSNLNRQFLYNKTHVGQSKAEIAAKISVERFSHREPSGVDGKLLKPISEVIPIHDSILKLKYDRKFYQQFTLVINALDNNSTRMHVNRMCLASGNIPLVESGSAGYFGNVTLIKGKVTKCFECEPPKKDENSYASCTIRSTPSLPIHCIVWAKHLFAQLFGQTDEDVSPNPDAVFSETESSEVSDEQKNQINDKGDNDNKDNNNESSTEKPPLQKSTREYVESINYDAEKLFQKLFHHDIMYLKKMKNLWKNRKDRHEPRQLSFKEIQNGQLEFDVKSSSTSSSTVCLDDQRLWSMKECLEIFVKSLKTLHERLLEKPGTILEWDKDDDIALNFVVAVSNFRCHCFFIQRKSKFETKSLAGNIIPAIASTNAIVGGFVLFQTLRLLKSLLPERIFSNPNDKSDMDSQQNSFTDEQLEQERQNIFANGFTVFISNTNKSRLSKIAVECLQTPKSTCLACSNQVKEIMVQLPFDRITLADLIERICIKKLKTIAPDINCYDQKKMIYAADDEDELKQSDSFYRQTLLSSLEYFHDGILLNVKDLEQDFEVNLRLYDFKFTSEDEEANDGELFKIQLNDQDLKSMYQEQNKNNNINNGDKINDEKNGEKNNDNDEEMAIEPSLSLKRKQIIDVLDEEITCLENDEENQIESSSEFLNNKNKRLKSSENN